MLANLIVLLMGNIEYLNKLLSTKNEYYPKVRDITIQYSWYSFYFCWFNVIVYFSHFFNQNEAFKICLHNLLTSKQFSRLSIFKLEKISSARCCNPGLLVRFSILMWYQDKDVFNNTIRLWASEDLDDHDDHNDRDYN